MGGGKKMNKTKTRFFGILKICAGLALCAPAPIAAGASIIYGCHVNSQENAKLYQEYKEAYPDGEFSAFLKSEYATNYNSAVNGLLTSVLAFTSSVAGGLVTVACEYAGRSKNISKNKDDKPFISGLFKEGFYETVHGDSVEWKSTSQLINYAKFMESDYAKDDMSISR